ncbi:PqiC family protein [Cellvibrio sp. OA-2007]|uniref:PqiC family protein n=1 Tax=Cellvibrio sp. OA-2007 TaxID=529823 RepID=UPI0007811EF1|nr:PqiC family protein [Cellvibrio sp. OA-2007]
MIRTFILTIITTSLLLGCQHSPRKQFYLLSATNSNTQATAITHSVGLGPIVVADYLQRSQLQVNNSENSLQLTENAYWGEPLQKGIIRVLAINLMNQDPSRAIEMFPWRQDSAPKFSIRLHIHELQVINGKAVINASWKLIDNSAKKTVSQHHYVNTHDCNGSPSDIAQAYSALLVTLADAINNALQQHSQLPM